MNMEDSKPDLTPPKEDIWDYLHKANKAALSIFPPAQAFYEMVINPPLQKRSVEWMYSVKQMFEEHSEKFESLRPENLRDNEEFIDLFFEVSERVKKTSDKEKVNRLRNYLLNCVISEDQSEREKLEILRIIDLIDYVHLEILLFFRKERYLLVDKLKNIYPVEKEGKKLKKYTKEKVNYETYFNINQEPEFGLFTKAEIYLNTFSSFINNQAKSLRGFSFRPFDIIGAIGSLYQNRLIKIYNMKTIEDLTIPDGQTLYIVQNIGTADLCLEYIEGIRTKKNTTNLEVS